MTGVEVEGLIVIVIGDGEVALETVDIGIATEESCRRGFCPGNVRTGSCIPKLAQPS